MKRPNGCSPLDRVEHWYADRKRRRIGGRLRVAAPVVEDSFEATHMAKVLQSSVVPLVV